MVALTSVVADHSMAIGPEKEDMTVYSPGFAKLLAKRDAKAASTNSQSEYQGRRNMAASTSSADIPSGDNYVYYALSKYMSKTYGR